MTPRRLAGLVILLVWAGFQTWQSWPDRQFHLAVLDVGQGDAILITTPANRQILVDGGPGDAVLPPLGENMPFWDRTIELLIVTHNHADHLGGLVEVARRYRVGEVWVSGAVYDSPDFAAWRAVVDQEHLPVKIVAAGHEMTVDGVHLDVLFPLVSQAGAAPHDPHDATVVVKVSSVAGSALLTGDIDEQHEQAMLQAHCPDAPLSPCPRLQADLLKVPHHGSRTGLLPAFLTAVAPTRAVISSGVNNRYGHPAQEIIDRLQVAGIPVYRTDEQGTIHVPLADPAHMVAQTTPANLAEEPVK